MSRIRFIAAQLPIRINSAAARVGAGIALRAGWERSTAEANESRKGSYGSALTGVTQSGMPEQYLSINGAVSPYPVSDQRYPVRNNLIFETNDQSLRIELWDVKIDVSFENTIVKTPMTKRRGTVKERISARDYSFSISGSLISAGQYEFPLEELKELIDLFGVEENINVSNVFINSFGVTKVVLESASLPQNNSKYLNAISFSLKLASDEDIELTIEQEG
jgi:hypothetical protein